MNLSTYERNNCVSISPTESDLHKYVHTQ